MQRQRKGLLGAAMVTCLVVAGMLPAAAHGPGHGHSGHGVSGEGGPRPIAQRVLAAAQPPVEPVPRAECGPGSIEEPDLQGRVPAEDVEAGGAAEGYRCNIEVVGREGGSGGYKVERYVDASGNECAYYDTTLLYPTNALNPGLEPTGTAVLDMSDPSSPVRTATLDTPAMQTPHESLLVNHARGLLAAVAGNPIFQAGQVDVYDISGDCREPELQSTLPIGILGHESGFAPDGNTFYAASLGGGTMTAIDLTDPAQPSIVYVGNHDTHAVTISDDGNRAYLAAGAGFPRNEAGLQSGDNGVVILDVSEIQSREALPEVRRVGAVTWADVTIPQAALPITVDGRPLLLEIDEFATTDEMRISGNGPRVGAARIIDITDETAPFVVSNIRLEVHQREHRPALAGDPDATSPTGGYAGHYCAVPRRDDPEIAACSFLASGLRVFDIRDPAQPREIAYFVAPVEAGGAANAAFSSAAFAPERNEIWYSDANRGFYALRLTNDAWPSADDPATPPAAPTETPAPPPPPPSEPGADATPQPAPAPRSDLPATGTAIPLALGALLLGVALISRRR
jgi:hypothetical protein